MLIVISPAKKLDMEGHELTLPKATKPQFLEQSKLLAAELKGFKSKDFMNLMGVSEKIADLNRERYQHWQVPFTQANAKPAILSFQGDVYQGMQAETFDKRNFEYAQKHLRILSGLYGFLRPLDLMQAYRLEMGVSLKNKQGNNLYEFWQETVTKHINKDLKKNKSDFLVNLASNEYFRVLDSKNISTEVITPVFKDYKNGQYKIISFFAKKARGMMAAHIIQNEIEDIEGLKTFSSGGYKFSKKLSQGNELVFTRKKAA